MNTLKSLINEAQTALFRSHNEQQVRALFAENYIQHNPNVPSGLEPLIGLMPVMKEHGLDITNHRMIVDEDLVLCHNSYSNADLFGAKEIVTFDLWRVDNQVVIEHWDCITPLVYDTASKRSQTDGPKSISDSADTRANKVLVKKFVEQVLIGGDTSVMQNYFNGDLYHQHNPNMKDGMQVLKKALESMPKERFHQKLHRIIGEGDFVLAQVEGSWNGKPQAIYDLFRIENGNIAEHWDIYQEIPAEMAHDNGMF